MTTLPIPLNELDVIGYADVLPEGRGPAVLPPIFQHRTKAEEFYVPPFRVAGNWLLEPHRVAIAELQDLEADEIVTLPKDFKRPAKPDHQLWVDENGAVRYESSSEAQREQNRIHQKFMEAAVTALRKGELDNSRRFAGIALAANDRALEPRAVIAAIHAVLGETAKASFMRTAAEQAGLNRDSFIAVIKSYLESIPPQTWERRKWNVEVVVETCRQLGFDVWIPFQFTEDDFRRFSPILHQFRRAGDEREFIVSCPGNEAILIAERETLMVAYNNAEAHISQVHRTNVLAVAAETMLHGTNEIANSCNTDSERIQSLGRKLRTQLRPFTAA